jgi:FMN hydrolase / 5-amino-6-(5-phospho-D-ribitylamino)uracil phosphatase
MTRLLVSIDVGGTIGQIDGPSLSTVLAKASPLAPAEARRIIRQKLHTEPSIGSAVIADVCDALGIPASAFPRAVEISPLRLVPAALTALQAMSQRATLVTLSNVNCLEADSDQLRHLLYPWALAHFPSCGIGYAKPDPAAFRYVAQACHTSTRHMVHVGDDWICDVVGARSAGVTAIWVSKGRSVPEPERLSDHGVLIADDIAAASRQVTELALRRRS